VIEEAQALLALWLGDEKRRSGGISWDNARSVAEQLRWLSKTAFALTLAAESAMGAAALR
jgi:hypothetical protein